MNTLVEKLDGYERILSKQTYLAGDEMTLADLFVSGGACFLKGVLSPALQAMNVSSSDTVRLVNIARTHYSILQSHGSKPTYRIAP